MMNPPAKASEKVHIILSGGAVEVAAELQGNISGTGFLWLDDGKEILDGKPISPWTDRIQGRAAANTDTDRPIGQANAGTGRIAVLGDGSSQDLDFGSTPAPGQLFIAFFFEDPMSSTAVLMGGPNGSDRLLLNTNGSVVFRAGGGGSVTIAASGTISPNTPSLLMVQRDASDDLTCRLNGVDVTDGTPSMSGTFDASHLMSQGNGNHMTGPLHSVIYNPTDDLPSLETQIESLWNQFHNDVVALP